MTPQTALSAGDAADIRQIGLPVQVRPRRLTQGRVAAVCAQLGEHVSVRNVQRVLGGSLRDVAPMVRRWREDHSAVDAALASHGGDAPQALGAIVLAAIEDLGQSLLAREPAAAPSESTHLVQAMRRLQETLDRQRPAAGLAQQSAVDAQFRSLATRLDALNRTLDAAELAAPAPADPLHPGLARLEAGLARVTEHLAVQDSLVTHRLDRQREALASDLAALRSAIAAQDSAQTLPAAVRALEERLDALDRSLRARGASPAVRKALQGLEARMQGMEGVLARLAGQLEAGGRSRRATKAPQRTATRKAARPLAKKTVSRKRPQRPAAAPRKTAIAKPATARKKATVLRAVARRPKTLPPSGQRVATKKPATPSKPRPRGARPAQKTPKPGRARTRAAKGKQQRQKRVGRRGEVGRG